MPVKIEVPYITISDGKENTINLFHREEDADGKIIAIKSELVRGINYMGGISGDKIMIYF